MIRKRQVPKVTYRDEGRGGSIAAALLNWFAVHQRDLPWRRSRDPYRIWVSEVMLQQTRVETVIPYYERWFERFPTLASLAAAQEEQVLKAWEGLGYYSRARNLQGAVREVVSRYGGEVPDDPAAISQLQGVGPYTAGAILSIAYNRSVAAVDGNVMRVLSRLFLIEEDIAKPSTRQAMEVLAQKLIPQGQAGAFNQALMELGALVCTPTSPKCQICPVALDCRAMEEGAQARLPVKAKTKAPRPVEMVSAVVWHEGRVLVARRPQSGLLGGLWEFPSSERQVGLSREQSLHQSLSERLGLEIEVVTGLIQVRHVFSHLVWDLHVFLARPAAGKPIPGWGDDLRWATPDELKSLAFPVAFQKVVAELR